MNAILERNYAEEVPPKEVKPSEGSTWYIPHHGVYHPKKNTLRVVFDCGAAYNNLLHLYSALFLDTQSALHSKGAISSSTTNVQHPPG